MRRGLLLMVALAAGLGCGRRPAFNDMEPMHQIWVQGHRLVLPPYRPEGASPLEPLAPPNSPWGSSMQFYRAQALWIQEDPWIFGVPAHPGVDYLASIPGGAAPGKLLRYRLHGLAIALYQRTQGNQWQRRGWYHPAADSHGELDRLVPLGDGTFLALARPEGFRDGDSLSPFARYVLDPNGELHFKGLINPMGDVPFLSLERGSNGDSLRARLWQAWAYTKNWSLSTKGLLLISGFEGCLSVLDPRDGRFVCRAAMPGLAEGRRYLSLQAQPAPDGSFLLVAGEAVKDWDEPRSSGRTLAAALLHHSGRDVEEDVEVHPRCFHLDPLTGQITPQALPPGLPSVMHHLTFETGYRFLVGPDGKLEALKQEER